MKNSKWFSRKLFMALAGVAIVIANDVFKMGLDQDTVWQFATVLAGYLFGQGIADAKKETKE
jgi:hypothetical protein